MPRVVFSTKEKFMLEQAFEEDNYLSNEKMNLLAQKLNKKPTSIKYWFRNHRRRTNQYVKQENKQKANGALYPELFGQKYFPAMTSGVFQPVIYYQYYYRVNSFSYCACNDCMQNIIPMDRAVNLAEQESINYSE